MNEVQKMYEYDHPERVVVRLERENKQLLEEISKLRGANLQLHQNYAEAKAEKDVEDEYIRKEWENKAEALKSELRKLLSIINCLMNTDISQLNKDVAIMLLLDTSSIALSSQELKARYAVKYQEILELLR